MHTDTLFSIFSEQFICSNIVYHKIERKSREKRKIKKGYFMLQFLIGLLIGGNIGAVTMALIQVSRGESYGD